MKTDEQKLKELDKKIKYAEENGLPMEKEVLSAIQILQNNLNQFLTDMEQQGRLNSTEVVHIEIRQYAAIKQLAKKINQPVDKYDELIKKAQCRIFGEENSNIFFKRN